MGDRSAAGGGGGGAGSWLGTGTFTGPDSSAMTQNIIPYIRYGHSALLSGLDPDSATYPDFDTLMGGLNVLTEIVAASSAVGGSPFATVASYDPSSDLADGATAIADVATAVDAYDPAELISTGMTDAATAVDGSLYNASRISTLMTAIDLRSRSTFLADMDDAFIGVLDSRAVISGQFPIAVAVAQVKRNQALDETEARLQLGFEDARSNAVINVMQSRESFKRAKITMQAQQANMVNEHARMTILAKNDQISLDLSYEEKDAKWNLDLLTEYGANLIAQGMGAIVPRAQTRGERMLAGFASSFSFGAQIAETTKNPALGLLGGAGSLVAQMLFTR